MNGKKIGQAIMMCICEKYVVVGKVRIFQICVEKAGNIVEE